MLAPRQLFVPYWLRVVRIGIRITLVALVALLGFWALPGDTVDSPWVYGAVLATAVVGVAIVALLPWERMFQGPLGEWGLYVWSALDIALISVAVAATGGGRSEMFLIYCLTTVFFGVYPIRGQVGLLVLTETAYLTVLGLTGWEIEPAILFLRTGTIAMLALMAGFLSGELMREMAAHHAAKDRSERWASLVATVASAAREMTLEHERVLDVVADAALALGMESVNFAVIDEDAGVYRIEHPRGMPEEYVTTEHPLDMGMTALVRRAGSTVVVDDYGAMPEAIAIMRDAGYRCVIGTPIWVDGWLTAVLVAGTRRERTLDADEVEAFELLASQASLALENARRFEEEHRTVERLNELDRLKSDFLATVSHELRTPVTVIEGTGWTLSERWEQLSEEERLALLQGLNANARSLDDIIARLLDFSKLESGRPDVRISRVDLSPRLEAMAERVRPLFVEGRTLETAIEPDLFVDVDPVFIERAVENLLSNAAKHSDPDAVVRLTGRADRSEVEVAVADDGPGIRPDDLRHLGDRFFRGGETNTRRTGGLGLGLALVREMLALHDAELRVDSELGSGSTFSFRLPLVRTRRARAHKAAVT
jgi:K+-sensing histidine kinase KdpD